MASASPGSLLIASASGGYSPSNEASASSQAVLRSSGRWMRSKRGVLFASSLLPKKMVKMPKAIPASDSVSSIEPPLRSC